MSIQAARHTPLALSAHDSVVRGALGWIAAVVVIGVLSWQLGAAPRAAAAAVAFALLPGLASLVLAPRLQENWAQAAAMYAWVAFACVGAAFTGGVASPMAACFLAAPALGRVTGSSARAAEAAMFAAIGFALAGAAAQVAPSTPDLDVLPPLAAIGAILLAGYWFAHDAQQGRDAPAAAMGARAPAAPLVWLDRAGRVTRITPAAARRLGLSTSPRRDALHALLDTRLDAEARTELRVAVAEALAGDDGRAEFRLGDATIVLETRADAEGVVATVLDVAPWAQRLDALEREAKAAKDARAARSRQTAELSHELRTPLSHILGFTEIMQRELYGPLSDRYKEYVGLIQTSGRNLLELISGLMDLSRLDGGRYVLERERFDVRDIVDEVVRLSSEAAAKREITLTADVPETALEVDADPRAVRQMLVNLTTNALKFTPPGGRVNVVAARTDGALVLDVVDNGPGISAEERARLGQAFERGAAAEGVEGVGLGLALTKGFAELHEGRLEFLDAPGGGALVRVTLPVIAKPRPGM